MNNLPTLGFLGTGMMATAAIEGFCERAADTSYPIVVANRTVDKAKALCNKYPDRVTLADSFQECVDKSDWVVIAVLPGFTEELLKSLTFRPDHKIISFVFSMGAEDIRPLLNCEVKEIVHMIPGTFVSVTSGPIITCPPSSEAEDIINHIGVAVPVKTKEEEEIIICYTASFAPFFSVQDALIKWGVNKGLSSEAATSYITSIFKALSEEVLSENEETIHRLATVNTPGGINMQAVEEITNAGGFLAFKDAMDSIYRRVRG